MGEYFLDYFQDVDSAASWLDEKVKVKPELAIVLTGGVEGPLPELKNKKELLAKDIPHFPSTRVEGHEGKLFFGDLNGKPIVALKGRYHFYEGHSPQEVVFPYFVLRKLGITSLNTTNAVGGVREDLNAGDIMRRQKLLFTRAALETLINPPTEPTEQADQNAAKEQNEPDEKPKPTKRPLASKTKKSPAESDA